MNKKNIKISHAYIKWYLINIYAYMSQIKKSDNPKRLFKFYLDRKMELDAQ